MACKLIWSPVSRNDLHDIVRFIARDNPRRAESFACELMAKADVLQEHPEIGRGVPEHRNPRIRELIFSPYRIVYRIDHAANFVEIVRIWHAARGSPRV